MNKKLIIGLVSGAVALFVIAGLAFWAKIYQNNLNKQLVKDREVAKQLDKLTVGYDNVPSGFYPNVPFEFVTFEYNSHFYEGLTRFDESYHLQPQLATSWENPNDTTWRFHLAKNVKFHDGSVMTANDVKASLDLAMTNENIAGMVPGLETVNIVDEYTVDLITSSASPILANSLTTVFMLPESLIKSQDFEHPVGTGPYKLASKTDDETMLQRFDSYHGVAPKVKTARLKFYPDNAVRLEALKKGEVDIIQTVEDAKGLGNTNDGTKILTGASSGIGVYYLVLDSVSDKTANFPGLTKNPFKDPRVRQAIRYSINNESLVSESGLLKAAAASQPLAPAVFGYNPNIKTPQRDTVKAKALMAEAGYPDGFTVTMDISRGYGQKVSAALAKQLEEATGIKVQFTQAQSVEEFMGKMASGDSSMFMIEYDCGTGDGLEAYRIMLGKQGFYGNSYQDETMEKLMVDAEGTFDLAKRKEYLQQLAVLTNESNAIISTIIPLQNFAYISKLNVNTRFDGYLTTDIISGEIPEDIQKDYTYFGAIKHAFGFKA